MITQLRQSSGLLMACSLQLAHSTRCASVIRLDGRIRWKSLMPGLSLASLGLKTALSLQLAVEVERSYLPTLSTGLLHSTVQSWCLFMSCIE